MERPLLTVTEAGQLTFPDVEPRAASRRILRWVHEGLVPAEVLLRPGRRLYLRRGPYLAWLEGPVNGNGAKV